MMTDGAYDAVNTCTHLLSIPAAVLFPIVQSLAPVFDRVLFRVLLASSAVVTTLGLHASDYVHVAQVNLKVLPYPSLHLPLWAPGATSLVHSQPAQERTYSERQIAITRISNLASNGLPWLSSKCRE